MRTWEQMQVQVSGKCTTAAHDRRWKRPAAVPKPGKTLTLHDCSIGAVGHLQRHTVATGVVLVREPAYTVHPLVAVSSPVSTFPARTGVYRRHHVGPTSAVQLKQGAVVLLRPPAQTSTG
jgi:hypothetical protein